MALLATYPIGWLALSGLLAITRPQDGPGALLTIVSPHLFLLGLALLPIAAIGRDRVLLLALAAYLVVGGVRFGPDWVSLPGPSSHGALHVISWNLEAGAAPADDVVATLLRQEADIIGVQELRPDVAAALASDPRVVERFPYRVLYPDRQVFGVGLLSRFPMEEMERFTQPVGLSARVALPGGSELFILNSHPMPGRLGRFGFDAVWRDRELAIIRPRIDALMDRSELVVVLGDYNVTPEEPGYGIIAAGLRDAHREVGLGPGWTWRPGRLKPWHVGFVRIDYVLTGPAIRPASTSEDCSYRGDHCVLRTALVVP